MSDEVKSLLSALIAKNLLVLILGIVFILIASLDGISIGDTPVNLPKTTVHVLWLLGFGLLVLGAYQTLKNRQQPSIRERSSDSTDPFATLDYLNREIQDQRQIVTKLKAALYEIGALVAGRNGDTSNQILRIISDLNLTIDDYDVSINHSGLTIQWFQERIEGWVKTIQSDAYPHIDPNEIESFRKDIRKCLDLICDNLREGVMYPPRHSNIEFQCNSASSYGAAMDEVKAAVNHELDVYPQSLAPRQRQEVIDCLVQMKQDILLHFEQDLRA
jgi:hypothetical protein